MNSSSGGEEEDFDSLVNQLTKKNNNFLRLRAEQTNIQTKKKDVGSDTFYQTGKYWKFENPKNIKHL